MGSFSNRVIANRMTPQTRDLHRFFIPLESMMNSNANQLSASPTKDGALQQRVSRYKRRIPLSIALIVFGIGACLVSLALVSNQYGNTDTIGLVLFGFSGWVLVTGICHLFIQFRYAALVGLYCRALIGCIFACPVLGSFICDGPAEPRISRLRSKRRFADSIRQSNGRNVR